MIFKTDDYKKFKIKFKKLRSYTKLQNHTVLTSGRASVIFEIPCKHPLSRLHFPLFICRYYQTSKLDHHSHAFFLNQKDREIPM
jgi:hypothetical protein